MHDALVRARVHDARDGRGRQPRGEAAREEAPAPAGEAHREALAGLGAGLQHVHGVHQERGGEGRSDGRDAVAPAAKVRLLERHLAVLVDQPPGHGLRTRAREGEEASAVEATNASYINIYVYIYIYIYIHIYEEKESGPGDRIMSLII